MHPQNIDKLPELEALRLGVDYKMTIQCRGYSIVLRPLSFDESNQIISDIHASLQRLPDYARTETAFRAAHAKETLKLASTSDVGVYDPQIHETLLKRLTTEEIMWL